MSEPALQVAADGSTTCGGSVVHTRIELVGWLGDGRVAFTRGYCGFGYRYFIVNADGSGFTQTDIKMRDVHLSPDGTKILFSRYEGPYVRVILANADGSGARVLSTQGTHQELPLPSKGGGYSPWSPDGDRIMFFADSSPERPSIRQYFCSGSVLPYVVNVDGSGVRRLVDSCAYGTFNGWSPSGEQVAFTMIPASGPPDVYAVKADGSGSVNLTNSPDWELNAAWLPRQ